MTEDQRAALKRLRRKIEIMHLDLKGSGDRRYHDTEELLALVKVLEKEQ